jgi:hypothetical protein
VPPRAHPLFLLLPALAILGCGSSEKSAALADPSAVIQFIQGLDDVRESPRSMSAMFASGSVPSAADLKKYAKFAFAPMGEPEAKGADVQIRVSVKDPKTEQEVSQQDWVLVKESDKWKLKSAPLP